jgi:hypothetical protein
MKIITKSIWQWDGTAYIKIAEEGHDFDGLVALACGATSQQNQIEQGQQNFATQLQTQAGSVFGNASNVFNNLMATFQPTVAAGPNQQGFSPQELSNLNSEAITQTGTSYQNAKAALGDQLSAEGGGNSALPSGTAIGENMGLAEAGANQTASELSGITEQNYAVGRQNYENAVQGEMGAPNVFNSSTSADNAATSAGSAAANTANQIATQQNSWMQPVVGALSGSLGAVTGGLTNSLLSSNTGIGGPDEQPQGPYNTSSNPSQAPPGTSAYTGNGQTAG